MAVVVANWSFSPLKLVSVIATILISSRCSWPLALVAESTSVRHLPGFHGPLPFELETGYVGVDELNDAQLFYYFIKSERNPKEDPLMLWLTGGPGCSGFTGLAYEIGPLKFDIAGYNGGLPTLLYDPVSWTKECSIIFLDSPIGTGFSYSRGVKGYEVGDLKSAGDIYSFIKKWFNDHQEFLSNPLYIGGDSYSGKTVPIVTQEISNGIQAGDEPLFNLKGYLIGNPLTDSKFDAGSLIPYLHGMGIISDELYESTKQSCGGVYTNPSNPQCAKYLASANQCMSGINIDHILEPVCFVATPKPHGVTDRRSIEEHTAKLYLSKPLLPLNCRSSGYLLSYFWTNNNTVREAIGIRKGTISEWKRCTYDRSSYTTDILSSLKYHFNLTTKGYRALIYSGDHDTVVPYLGTQAWIRSLNFSIVDDWRSWSVDGQVAGFTRMYSNNLTFATVKGGGHTAPEYRPKECLAMFQRWISSDPL